MKREFFIMKMMPSWCVMLFIMQICFTQLEASPVAVSDSEAEVLTNCGCECARAWWTDTCDRKVGQTCEQEGELLPDPTDCENYLVCSQLGRNEFRYELVQCDDDLVFNPATWRCIEPEELTCASFFNSTDVCEVPASDRADCGGGDAVSCRSLGCCWEDSNVDRRCYQARSVPLFACASSPCLNGGVCIDYTNGSFGCACDLRCPGAHGLVGDVCEYSSNDSMDREDLCTNRTDGWYPFSGACNEFVECPDPARVRDCKTLNPDCGRLGDCYFDYDSQQCVLVEGCGCECSRADWTNDCDSRDGDTCFLLGERRGESSDCQSYAECVMVNSTRQYEKRQCLDGESFDISTKKCVEKDILYCSSDSSFCVTPPTGLTTPRTTSTTTTTAPPGLTTEVTTAAPELTTQSGNTTELTCGCLCAEKYWTNDCSSRDGTACTDEGIRLPESNSCDQYTECTAIGGGSYVYQMKQCPAGQVFDPVSWDCLSDNVLVCSDGNVTEPLGPCASNPCQFDGECIEYTDGTYGCVCQVACTCLQGKVGDNCENGVVDIDDEAGRLQMCEGQPQGQFLPFAGRCDVYIACPIFPGDPTYVRYCHLGFPQVCPNEGDCYFIASSETCVPKSPLPTECELV